MERDFRYLRDAHGDAGARELFEKICSQLLHVLFSESSHNIRSSPGDGDIDILVGDFSLPIENYQCKYFVDGIGDAQRSQIRESFAVAIGSADYTMKRWVLCIPCIMNLKEFEWWSDWKNKSQQQHHIAIDLWDATFLLSELKKQNIYDTAFDNNQKLLLQEILESVSSQELRVQNELITFVQDASQLGFQDAIFVKKLENAQIREIDGCKRDFFNAELSEHALKSKGNPQDIVQFENLKFKVFSIWETQYRSSQSEDDENELLTKVYERVENLDSSTLQGTLSELNLFAKRGILHQRAEDCSIGWLRDYRTKLEEYMKREATDDV